MATWLKIEGGIVTQGIVMRGKQDMTHIAALGLDGHWVQSDTAGIGWAYAGGEFTPPVAPVVVPQTITRRQGRLALLQAGLLEQAEAFIEAGGAAAAIEYEAGTWERNNPFLTQVWEALGGDSQGLDDLFTTAASL
jgi:hypothetical protein